MGSDRRLLDGQGRGDLAVRWLGAVAAYLALDIVTVNSQDVATVRGGHLAKDITTSCVIVPLAWAASPTGLLQSVGTTWGLFRHYRVLAKLMLTVVATIVLLAETRTVTALADYAATSADPRALPGTLPHSIGGLAVLLLITILSVVKPQGLTRHGWRKQQDNRRRKAASRASTVA
ncbi:hypothetical protein [Nonomuraea rubra]|uniref:hypothetical protein n=1 Tax=Nonomuraea rubra TaxID=46180 RepID=UPI0033CD20E2